MREKENLNYDFNFEPNPLFFQMIEFYHDNRKQINPGTGQRSRVTICNSGGSRSGKTLAAFDVIIYFCNQFRNHPEKLSIYVVRKTLKSCREKTYDEDFVPHMKRRNLWNGKNAINEGQSPEYHLWGSTIKFIGLDADEELAGSDIVFINEALDINSEKTINNQLLRCRKLAILDWNPKLSFHFLFKWEGRFNTLFTRTTWRDNKHIPPTVLGNILSYCPWDLKDFDEATLTWRVPEDKRSPHPVNVPEGTANLHDYLVYDLGISCPETGAVFQDVTFIDTFPDDCDDVVFGLDMGYSCLSGETKIKTIKGDVSIKNIKKGDLILTDKGYFPVIDVLKKGEKEVVEKHIGTDFGYRKIICTFDHKFKTNKGWKQLDELQIGEQLLMNVSTTEKFTEDTSTESTQTIFTQEGINIFFTDKCGRIITEKYLKVSIYIISMVIRLITRFQTLQLSLIRNMQNCTNILRESCQKEDLQKKIGTKGEKKSTKNSKTLLRHVYRVAKNLLQRMFTNYLVHPNVTTYGNTKQKKTLKPIFAKFAEELSKEINTLNKKLVHINVRMSYQVLTELKTICVKKAEVYDISVMGVNCYFANDILVHNCDPSVLTKCGKKGRDIFIEYMTYNPTPHSRILFDQIMPILQKEVALRELDANGLDFPAIYVACDSADKFKDMQFVKDLNSYISEHNRPLNTLLEYAQSEDERKRIEGELIHHIGFFKVKKPHIVVRLSNMKKYRIHVVRYLHGSTQTPAVDEFTNYVYMTIEGNPTNIPIDDWNHGIDSAGYPIYHFWRWNG